MAASYGSPFDVPPGSRTFPVLEARHPKRTDQPSFEAVTILPFAVAAEITVSSSAFQPNARLSPIESTAVEELRPHFERVQRILAGQKKSNVAGALREYIDKRVMELDDDGFPKGWLPSSVIYFPKRLTIQNGVAIVPPGVRGILFDGDSRHESKLNSLGQAKEKAHRDALLSHETAYQILHGVPVTKARPWFSDVNGRAVVVNANLLIGREEEDVYARVSRIVFEKHAVGLEIEKRQVAPSSDKVLTALQARTFVAAMALGVSRAVQAGAKPLPQDDVNAQALEDGAVEYLDELLARFSPDLLKSREMVLRATPVLACLGALGAPWVDGDEDGKARALAILDDDRIDWSVGERWAGLAGKVNPATGVFTVGGGKEYASQTWAALTMEGSPSWGRLRGVVRPRDADTAVAA